MGLGILDIRTHGQVPGTSTLHERQSNLTPQASTPLPNLKYNRSGKTPILLVPQPSDDPNDPLNQPLWRRDLQLVILSLLAIIATTLSPILAANSLALAFYFELDFTGIALLTGWHLLAVGLSGIFFVPSARVWGKRHLYLLGAALVCASCAWAGASSSSYRSLLWSRVVQGIGLAPYEALVNASVGDLFFVHERGKRMALSNLALFGGAFFTPVIAGVITTNMGWQWTFNFVSIFAGALFPLLFFFVPETAYRRDYEYDPTNRSSEDTTPPQATVDNTPTAGGEKSGHAHEYYAPSKEPQTSPTSGGNHQKQSYWRTLLPFNGRKSDENIFQLILRPFPLFAQPGILWACLIQGTLIGWTVLIGIVLAAILLGPPLFFTTEKVGFMYSAAFVGALVGFIVCGLLADSSAGWLTRRNGGIYEPEFRMILVIPQFVFGAIGLYGFGITANDAYVYGWHGPAVCFGFEVAGMVCGAVASALYITDAHPDIAVEAFTCLLICKNVFSFGLTFHGYDWLVAQGVYKIFIIIASVQVGVCATTIFMYIFGKWNRSFWARHNMLRALKLR